MDVLSAISPPASPAKATSPAGEAADQGDSGFLDLLAGSTPPAAANADASQKSDQGEAAASMETGSATAGAMMASLLNIMLVPQQPQSPQIAIPATPQPPGNAQGVRDVHADAVPAATQAIGTEQIDVLPTPQQYPSPSLLQAAATKPAPSANQSLPVADAQLNVTADASTPAEMVVPAARLDATASAPVQRIAEGDSAKPGNGNPMMTGGTDKPLPPVTANAAPVISAISDGDGESDASGANPGDANGTQTADTAATAHAVETRDSAFAGLLTQAPDPKSQVLQAAADTSGAELEGLKDHIPPGEQVAVHMAGRAANGDSHISIQLKPVELGTVDVRIETRQDGDISIHMRVERPETLDLLQRDARHLERALNEAGLKADSGSLSFSLRQDQGQAFADRRWMQQAPSYQQGAQGTGDMPVDPGRPYRPTPSAIDRIDITV